MLGSRLVASFSVLLVAASVSRPARAVAGAACSTVHAVVTIDWSDEETRAVQGIVTRVSFPPSLRFDKQAGEKGAVENLTGVSGALFDASARDADGDGAQDLLSIGIVGASVPKGSFARVRFACGDDAAPKDADFACTLEAASPMGDVPGTCRVRLEVGSAA